MVVLGNEVQEHRDGETMLSCGPKYDSKPNGQAEMRTLVQGTPPLSAVHSRTRVTFMDCALHWMAHHMVHCPVEPRDSTPATPWQRVRRKHSWGLRFFQEAEFARIQTCSGCSRGTHHVEIWRPEGKYIVWQIDRQSRMHTLGSYTLF